ncbi:MAG TPA: ABC transporter ATP-binding protein [Rectinemataceae bacterium]|nr:ABC transporter ATP-binding protein [Rectinemataceae bacterium]
MKPRNPHLAWVWDIWKKRKGLIGLLLFLTLLSSAVAAAYPLVAKMVLDAIQSALDKGSKGSAGAGARATILRFVNLILAIGAAGFVASLFPGIRGVMNNIFEHEIRTRYFGEAMKKDQAFFAHFRTGDLVTRLTDGLGPVNDGMSWFLCSGIFRAVESTSKLVFCLVAMFLLDWRLACLSLLPLPLMIGFFFFAQERVFDSYRRNQEAISDINSQLEQSFAGARIIKAFACEATYGRFFDEALARRFGTELRLVRLDSLMGLIFQYIEYFAQIGVVFAGGWMAVSGSIGIGTFYAFYSWLGMLVIPIMDLPNLFVAGKRTFAAVDRIEEIRTWPDSPPPEAPVSIDRIESIEFETVDFAYHRHEVGDEEDQVAKAGAASRRPALQSCSFRIEAGERLVVVGPVGSGKSTLMKLAAGILLPSSGRILVNGMPLDSIEAGSLSRQIGYVPQESLLFSGSIRENVALGLPEAEALIGEEDFRRAISVAALADEIENLPAGAETLLGQRGISLSGGQRQRVAVARALARRPSILLFDDITASLDAANEERLWRALDRETGRSAAIVVSHRVSTLAFADKVLFLLEGRPLAFGRHEELFETNSDYRAFIGEHFLRRVGD